MLPRIVKVVSICWLVCAAPLLGAELRLDDAYVTLLGRIQEADRLATAGDGEGAQKLYASALKELRSFQQQHPEWHPDVVNYRIRYLESRNGATLGHPEGKGTNAIGTSSPSEVEVLRSRALQFDEERALLQAKLREALAGRPAALDPGELERAEAQIREQRKEIDLLKHQLAREHTAGTNDPSPLEKARGDLSASRRREAQLAERSSALEKRLKELERQSGSARAGDPLADRPTAGAGTNSATVPPDLLPTTSEAVELAAGLLDRGDIPGASAALGRAPHTASTNAAFLAIRARISVAQGRPEEAVRSLGAAMQLRPATAEMQHQLGRALLAQGSAEAARSVLTKAVAMDPACSGAHLALAGLLARRQPPDLALARWHYGRALQTGARRDPAVERTLGIPAGATNALPAAPRVPLQPAAGSPSTPGT